MAGTRAICPAPTTPSFLTSAGAPVAGLELNDRRAEVAVSLASGLIE